MRASLVIILLFGAANQCIAQELPFKVDLSYFPTRWGMKVKFVGPPVPFGKEKARMGYVLVFDKDLPPYELDDLRRVLFEPRQQVRHIFFDEDNIAMDANFQYLVGVQGAVSGVKGEAIRIVFEFGNGLEQNANITLQRARKLVVRPPN